MLRVFQHDLRDPAHFVITLELVPGRESTGRKVDTVMGIARDAMADGRISAVSITDNPGGNPSQGIHLGGIHRDFSLVARILDRLERIADRWPEFLADFGMAAPPEEHAAPAAGGGVCAMVGGAPPALAPLEKLHFSLMRQAHGMFFSRESASAGLWRALARRLDSHPAGRMIASTLEDPVKRLLLGCRHCGDCGIVHLAFLCPESQCPKHTRNGACGGSRNGRCEVHPDRYCVWYRAWRRWAASGESHRLAEGCVPPRRWELNETASWLNFHLGRDHQGSGDAFARFCRSRTCRTEGLRG